VRAAPIAQRLAVTVSSNRRRRVAVEAVAEAILCLSFERRTMVEHVDHAGGQLEQAAEAVLDAQIHIDLRAHPLAALKPYDLRLRDSK
jgi:hypothetical protein